MREYAGIDLGASSGRVVCGRLSDGVMALEEVHRFPNRPVRLPDGLHWDLLHLFSEALSALRGRRLDGVAIDSWAVDYALLDERGRPLGMPFHYRDERTRPLLASFPSEEAYAITGIRTMPINTALQLMAERDSPALHTADRIAMVPDLLTHWLTGELVNERTNASTTALLDARTGEWSHPLIERLGLPSRPFGDLVDPGTRLGPVLAHHGVDAPGFAVASHDTASAFAAAPVQGEGAAILSSGTWSLLGVESRQPVLTDPELSNERGLDGTIRLLRNVMGLWLVQECARAWQVEPTELRSAAQQAPAEVALFDPDDSALLSPGDMPARITAACGSREMGRGEIVRSILVSLACRYSEVIERLQEASGRAVDRIHVIGGGARHALLCQLTADLCDRPVLAGPVEAAALGNLLVQARADEQLGSLSSLRAVSAASVDVVVYQPELADAARRRTLARFAEATSAGAVHA